MSLAAGLVGVLAGAGAMALAMQGTADPRRAEIETIIREYLLEHPELLNEMAQRFQDREQAKAINANRAAYETPYAGAWAGAEDGDVVLVEFFDYACIYCRQSAPDVERLLAEDKKLKVVWRELPVLGEQSVVAAEASLAAARQGKFHDFYKAMYAQGARPTDEAIAAAKKAAGVTPEAARTSARPEIEKNLELARGVGASGTPVFVIGDKVLHGAAGYEALKAAVAEARKKG